MYQRITLVSLLLGALALLSVPGALAKRAYTDPVGDAGTAPDITALRVSHDAGGNITLLATTNQPDLAPDATVYVYVDSDRNPATGMSVRGIGADHVFSHDGEYGTGFVWHVSGNFIIIDFTSTLVTGYSAGTLTARINRTDLDEASRFTFLVEAERDDEIDTTPNDADFAPDAAPFYEYSLVSVSLTVGKPVAAKPVAGKRFTVSAPVTRSDGSPFSTGTVSCKARAGTTQLSPVGQVAGGSARCAMKVPKAAKGKLLRGTLTVSAEDAPAVTRPFAYRVG